MHEPHHPHNTSHSWFPTDPTLLQHFFHTRMLEYPLLTNDPALADAIYVPYYTVLDRFFKGRVRKMRKKLIEMIPRIVYRRHGSSLGLRNQKDAFDIAIEGTIQRVKARLESLGDM
ncbi:probable xyloglucan galactosyltransferase GT19 [Tanacetum coccineum]